MADTTVMPENDTESNPHAHNSLHNADNSISITQNEQIDSANICYSPSWSLPANSNEHYNRIDDDANHEIDDDVSSPILPTSLKFNRNTMSISVKRLAAKTAADRIAQRFESTINPSDFNEDNENLICSPHFGAIESLDANHSNHSEPNAITHNQFDRFNFDARHLNENFKQLYQSHDTDHEVDGELKSKESPNDRLMKLIRCKDPLRSAVVLRSPRGNQPRSYTTDALYSALMDVKSGESIYR